ncbi:MAG: TonB-dependent receptor [Methylotenera sp.]|nr:TonB-dependent receptor [Methylotenera sp.]MDP3059366.1 TonB-dependent receptor [Methylotenera sp.]MDP3183224.1 TonB-dependent receptor [Desulfobaccales bacterium]
MIKNLNRKKSAIAVAIACSVMVTFAHADESIKLDKVEVAGILPEKLETVPGSYAVIDQDELDVSRPFSVQEALNNVPGVHVVGENSFGLGVNIGVRGLDPRRTSRTLLLEDGMPVHLGPYGDPSAHFTTPIERVQRIEVVKGSGQILYGPQTVGGMINFVTKPVPKNGVEGSVSAMAGNNDFTGLHANVGYGGERGGIMIDAIQKKGDGIRDNHDFDMQDIMLKGQLNLTDSQTLIAKVGYYEEDSHVSETGLGALEYAQDKYQAPTGKNDQFKYERKSLHLTHLFDINDKTKLTTNAYYVDAFRTSFRQINAPGTLNNGTQTGFSVMDRCQGLGVATEANAEQCGGRHRPRSYDYWGIEPRLDFKHSLFGVDSDAVVGFRYHEEGNKRQQFRDGNPLAQNLNWAKANGSFREDIRIDIEAKSYYAQNTFYLGDWTLTPGVRVEDVRKTINVLQAEGDPQGFKKSYSQTVTLPGLGATWNGIANTTVFAGIHRGFAPPRPSRDINFDDLAGLDAISATRAEESTNTEIGVRSNYFKGVAFEAALFNIDFDEIVIQQTAGNFVNAGELQNTGIELGARVDFGAIYNTPHNFYVMGNYTNLFKAKFKKDTNESTKGNRLPYAPRDIASVNFGYQHPIGLDARIGVDYVSQQYVDADNTTVESLDGQEGRIPAYTLLNASVNFRPVGSKVSYFMSGHNLADKEYLVSRVDGKVAGRQRQVFAGIRYDF